MRHWHGQFRIRQQVFYASLGGNGGTMRLGAWVETRSHCADHSLWHDTYVHFGPEKGRMWYTANIEFAFVLPWLRFVFQWRRAVPRSVREHLAKVRKLAAVRREESYAVMRGFAQPW